MTGTGGDPESSVLLEGQPEELANDHIPDIPFPADAFDDVTEVDGVLLSHSHIGLVFSDTTTVGEANALLSDLGAAVVGGNPWGRLLLVRLPASSDLTGMSRALDRLDDEPIVVALMPETGATARSLVPHHTDQTNWMWEVTGLTWFRGGAWGLQAIRAPAAWNLRAMIERAIERGSPLVDVLIVDMGVAQNHPDLSRLVVLPSTDVDDHGTMVAGIVGADHDNAVGIEGVTPYATLYAQDEPYTPGGGFDLLTEVQWLRTLDDILRDLRTYPTIRVVNVSMGFADCPNPTGRVPAHPTWTWQQFADATGNAFFLTTQSFAGTVRDDFLIVGAVGNGDQCPAVVDSPISNAAASFPLGHFESVENIGVNGILLSNTGGTFSGPGWNIRTTEAQDDEDADGDGQPLYADGSGTSFAAPFVTGSVAYLWQAQPNLTYLEIKQLLRSTNRTPTRPSNPPAGFVPPAPIVDLFGAVVAIDSLNRGEAIIQSALVDVDDGTLDGNQRTERDATGRIVNSFEAITTTDGRRGDGQIDMADFRAFRDAMAQAGLEGWDGDGISDLAAVDVSLDGQSDHPKKDLNGDGCVGDAPLFESLAQNCADTTTLENAFSRFDFNGDGRVNHDAVGGSSGFPAMLAHDRDVHYWEDVDVLEDRWPDDPNLSEGWTALDLVNLLPGPDGGAASGSADIEFRTTLPLGDDAAMDEIAITITGLPMTRSLIPSVNGESPRLVWTVPIGMDIEINVEGRYRSERVEEDLCLSRLMPLEGLRIAEDTVVSIGPCLPGVEINNWAEVEAETRWYVSEDYNETQVLEYINMDSDGDLLEYADIDCTELAVGQECSFELDFPTSYGLGEMSALVTRTEVDHWQIQVELSASPLQPPLPVPPTNTCGDTDTECMAFSKVTISNTLILHTGLWGPEYYSLDLQCTADGRHITHEDESISETRFGVWLSSGDFLEQCGGASGPPDHWQIDGRDTFSSNRIGTGGSPIANGLALNLTWEALAASVREELPPGYTDRDYESSVDMFVTLELTVTPQTP